VCMSGMGSFRSVSDGRAAPDGFAPGAARFRLEAVD
jgi:hypothetical protein